MKRALVIALLLALTACLCACGGKEDKAAAAPAGTAAPAQKVDLDLSKLSGTVVYSQVYDMMVDPDAYLGQVVRVKGNFNSFKDADTQQEYFAVVIADATACCAQGMEFVWKGDHAFPRDYPDLDSEITVTGTFSTYEEGGFQYIQLADADMTVV